jgi:DNA-binding CsgD family transcriptional regulator
MLGSTAARFTPFAEGKSTDVNSCIDPAQGGRQIPPMPSKRPIAIVQSLCALELGPQGFVAALLEALHEIVPSERNLFDWSDEDGRLLHYYIEGPVDVDIARLYFEEFHNRREGQCMPAFNSLRDAPQGVRSARELDHPAFYASDLYQQIWRPQGLHSRVECVIRGRSGRLLGSLVLYRGPDQPLFTAAEERTLGELIPWIARGLEAPGATPESDYVQGPDAPECLVMSLDGAVLGASPGAARLLMLADEGLSEHSTTWALAVLAQRQLGPLLAQLRTLMKAGPHETSRRRPSQTRLNALGRFDARATLLWPLPGDARRQTLAQITLTWMEPQRLAVSRALRKLPLTAGQAVVCSALLHGQSKGEIAERCGVAPTTVADHVRKIYRALDVASTWELRSLIDAKLRREPA